MKKSIIYFTILLIFAISCNTVEKDNPTSSNSTNQTLEMDEDNNEKIETSEVTSKKWLIYEGVLGDYEKHVVVFLNVEESNKVIGSYFYSKHQKSLSLQGTFDPNSGIYSLIESYKGKTTGYLSFKNQNGNLNGSWKKSKTDAKNQPLKLNFLTSLNGQVPNVDFLKYENKHEIFVYNGDGEDYYDVVDELKISKINDQFYSFDYNVTGQNAHTGAADGIIKMDNSVNGHFYGVENCHLEFRFKKDEVEINANDCGYYHGMRAHLDNTLTLKK